MFCSLGFIFVYFLGFLSEGLICVFLKYYSDSAKYVNGEMNAVCVLLRFLKEVKMVKVIDAALLHSVIFDFIFSSILSLPLGLIFSYCYSNLKWSYTAWNIIEILFLGGYTITVNCNHKILGIYYLSLSLIFGFSGTIYSYFIRCELYSSGNRIINTENQNFYNSIFTLHGLLMIFFLVMPAIYGGFGNYFIPGLVPAPEVGFPRINLFSLFLSYYQLFWNLVEPQHGPSIHR